MRLFEFRFIQSEETVEIFIEADSETLPEERRRFAILNIPRHQFSEATGAAARRATASSRPQRRGTINILCPGGDK